MSKEKIFISCLKIILSNYLTCSGIDIAANWYNQIHDHGSWCSNRKYCLSQLEAEDVWGRCSHPGDEDYGLGQQASTYISGNTTRCVRFTSTCIYTDNIQDIHFSHEIKGSNIQSFGSEFQTNVFYFGRELFLNVHHEFGIFQH